jgi:DNA repair exonuclease SbcCD ATPase subunit
MQIKSLKLKNFKLFQTETFEFGKINILKGTNLDDAQSSSNGSGKSSVLEGIIFGLFGEGSGKNLADLVTFNTKSTEVELVVDKLSLIRKIPTALQILDSGKEIEFNTNTLKQTYLTKLVETYDFFKKYRLVNKQAVNLLDLGIVSLRKELMSFIDTDFSSIRTNLLAHKLDRETYNVNKKFYQFSLSTKRLEILEQAITIFKTELNGFITQRRDAFKALSEVQGKIKGLEYIIKNNKDVAEQIKTKKCPTCGTVLGTEKINAIKGKGQGELAELQRQIKVLEAVAENAKIDVEYAEEMEIKTETELGRASQCAMKLKEAFKFADYKYTKVDVELYASAVKVLDDFAGWYVQNWLNNLTVILNDLLSTVNLSVEFSADKQFLTIVNEKQQMKYEQLSSGQQIFLNCVFKLAILLNNGIGSGVLVIDEGIGQLDLTNLHKLIDILKTLNFQVFLVYQNIDEIEGTSVLEIERKDNRSYKK